MGCRKWWATNEKTSSTKLKKKEKIVQEMKKGGFAKLCW